MTDAILNEATAQLADDIIEAAQALERAAKTLKAHAGIYRKHGVVSTDASQACSLQRMHKHYDIVRAAELALKAIKFEGPNVSIRTEQGSW